MHEAHAATDDRRDTPPPAEETPLEAVDSVIVTRPRADLYAFWRNFTNLPKFMERVQRVTEVDSISSLWTVKDDQGGAAEWEFIVTDDERDRLIAWSASGNTPVKYSGRVEFRDAPEQERDAPEQERTEVTATVHYDPPAGLIGNLIAKVAGNGPVIQTRNDLKRFKELMEAGTISS
jgi:uncharacterized membrane protein